MIIKKSWKKNKNNFTRWRSILRIDILTKNVTRLWDTTQKKMKVNKSFRRSSILTLIQNQPVQSTSKLIILAVSIDLRMTKKVFKKTTDRIKIQIFSVFFTIAIILGLSYPFTFPPFNFSSSVHSLKYFK